MPSWHEKAVKRALSVLLLLVLCSGITWGKERSLSPGEMLKLLPPDNFSPGWRPQGKPETYTKDALYLLVDGEAEMYYLYHFVNAAACTYLYKQDPTCFLSVELFQMENAFMGFGIYSTYRTPESGFIPLGAEAFGDTQYIYMYKGRFLARITCPEPGTGQSPLREAARRLSESIPDDPSPPREISLLDCPARTPHSEKVIMDGFLGVAGLPPVMQLEFRREGKTLKGFIVFPENTEEQASALKSLLDLTPLYTRRIGLLGNNELAFGMTSSHEGLKICRLRNYLVGLYGLSGEKEGDSLLLEISRLLEPEVPSPSR